MLLKTESVFRKAYSYQHILTAAHSEKVCLPVLLDFPKAFDIHGLLVAKSHVILAKDAMKLLSCLSDRIQIVRTGYQIDQFIVDIGVTACTINYTGICTSTNIIIILN